MKVFPYKITVEFSVPDECYIASVPKLLYHLAHGATPESAVKQARIAATAMLKVMAKEGRKLP